MTSSVASRIAVATLLWLPSACAPHCDDFRFAALQLDGAVVTEGPPPKGVVLSKGSSMPIGYQADRGAYTIAVSLGERALLPGFVIDVRAPDRSTSYSIEPLTGSQCLAWHKVSDRWTVRLETIDCDDVGTVEFRVRNPAGTVVGTDSIRYRIVHGGTYCVVDGV